MNTQKTIINYLIPSETARLSSSHRLVTPPRPDRPQWDDLPPLVEMNIVSIQSNTVWFTMVLQISTGARETG